MDLNMRVGSFVQLGKIFNYLGESKQWDGFHLGINKQEFDDLNQAILTAKIHNAWFDEINVRLAFKHLALMLKEDGLKTWVSEYSIPNNLSDKTVALIMAGNIPMVGFYDLLCVLISGHKAMVKLSSDDTVLMLAVINLIGILNPDLKKRVSIVNGKMIGFDAVIATGSDNTARYFETYFEKYPSIIRKNRTSIAVLDGEETEEELDALADDVFTFYGLGCRNVSKVYLPEGFDLNRLFKVFFKFKDVLNSNKYNNNYDYNKAVFMMNKIDFVENGFLILKEDPSLHSPLSVLHYEYYSNKKQIDNIIKENESKLQCIVGKDNKWNLFGASQKPLLKDAPDNIDVMVFLLKT